MKKENIFLIIKELLAFIIIFLCQNSFAQGRKSLDNEFGIGKFKLNSDYDLYEKDLKYN